MPLFRNHGDFHIRVEGRIIHSEVTGPWNIETAQDYMRQLDLVVEQQMGGQSWASLVVCRESILFPLDIFDTTAAALAWLQPLLDEATASP